MFEITDPTESHKEYPGPILLLAGPGTGKTYQLTHRIQYLIDERNVPTSEIAVITFTNEAARNMREKLLNEIHLPKEKHPEIISTMHSLANSIVGAHTKLAGLPDNYDVLTERFPQEIIFQDASFLSGFSRSDYKESLDCRIKGNSNDDLDDKKSKICKKYEELLRKCAVIDYDDQILLANKLLRENDEIRNDWSKKTKHLLVDEYQDINAAQFELILLLCSQNLEGLFVVGDDDQSIYSFRGGSPSFIQNFEKYFGENYKIGRLSKSWRCPEFILKSAKEIIKKYYPSSVQKPEPTFPNQEKFRDSKIIFRDVPSSKKEAEYICRIVKEKCRDKKICIIIPNGNYLPEIKETLRWNKLPYRNKSKLNEDGLNRFLLLEDWVSQKDNNILLRMILELIINNHSEFTKNYPSKTKNITEKRELFSNFIATLWSEVNDRNSLFKILQSKKFSEEYTELIQNLCGYLIEIIDMVEKDGRKKKSLSKFLEKAGLYLLPGKHPNGLLSEIREWKSELIGTTLFESSIQPIEIYNLPSSKGLEGDIIIIVGLSENLFPNPERNLEEQSRLFYVAMTRAKEELYIFSARSRSAQITYNKDASYQLKKSQFISCLPKEFLLEEYKPY